MLPSSHLLPPEHLPATSPPISIPSLLERCMGNASVARLMLTAFEQQVAADLVTLERHLANDDAEQFARCAHGLKGAAGTVAASALHDLITTLELDARNNGLDMARQRLSLLRAEIGRCVLYFPAAHDELRPAGPGADAGSPRRCQ